MRAPVYGDDAAQLGLHDKAEIDEAISHIKMNRLVAYLACNCSYIVICIILWPLQVYKPPREHCEEQTLLSVKRSGSGVWHVSHFLC